MNENNTNTNKTAVDEYNGATVTLPLAKLLQIVTDRAVARTLNDEWATKYWLLHAEKEALKKQLEEMRLAMT
jgi:hypothetical protein